MNRPFLNRTLIAGACIAIAFSGGCAPSIAPYSLQAYEYAIDIKVDALRLMDRAELPYAESERQAESLLVRMDKAYEFAKGRPQNDHSTQQWSLMIDPAAHLMGGFLARWEAESALSRGFIAEAERIISDGFDAIIGLESGKIGNGTDIGGRR